MFIFRFFFNLKNQTGGNTSQNILSQKPSLNMHNSIPTSIIFKINRRSFGGSLTAHEITAMLDISDSEFSDCRASDSEYIPNC